MNQERYQKLKTLVERALELQEFERDAFLQQECATDIKLLAEARDLLMHHRTDTEIDSGLDGTAGDLPEMIGRSIGPYKILESIGEGGMGVVYLAGQSAPLRRKVALKVIKLGMDTREVISRFESERQALALMDHANIAKVLDAGATGEGRPYFVMEYIQGVPLNKYCEENNLGLQDRLDLFIQVCRGVQHAHSKGIIHRDLKPGNILVAEIEGEPVPKIIDFGVAKATSHHLAAQTLFTQQGQMIGTPEYMSPEQAGTGVADVDTRSDVYSLGVVLYELLTGVLPLERREIMRAGLERMALLVQNEIPKKPSTRIDTVAKTETRSPTEYGGNTRLWVKRVRGDLDWITMKALEKEPDRRYDTPTEFAADIERHLNNEPVVASPPSGLYRARKFVQRNRAGVTVSLILLLSLVAGVIGTSVGMVKSRRSEEKAVAAAGRAESLALFQNSRLEETQAEGLPYIIGALEKEDRAEYRLHAKRLLLQSAPYWQLPRVPKARNPISADFSPDGKLLAVSWGRDGKFQIHDLAGGETRVFSEQEGMVHWVTFSGDSRYLVSAAGDSTLALWDLDAGEVVQKFKLPGGPIPFFDPGGTSLYVGVAGSGFISWHELELSDGSSRELGRISGQAATLFDLAWPDLDPSRRWIAQPVGERLELYDLMDIAAGPVDTIWNHGQDVAGAVFTLDGSRVAAFDADGKVGLWDVQSPDGGPLRWFQANERPLDVRFDASGRRLAVGGGGGVKMWDLDLPEFALPREFRNRCGWAFGAAFHPTEPWLVSYGTGSMVAAWPLDFELPMLLRISETEDLSALGFSPDGKHLIVASFDGTIWDVPLTGTRIGQPKIVSFHDGFGFGGIHFDDGSQYAFLSNCNGESGAGVVVRVSLATGEVSLFDGFTCNVVVDGSGRFLASSPDPALSVHLIRIYDTETGAESFLDGSMAEYIKACGFTRDGRLVVFGPEGVGLWDMEKQKYEQLAQDMTYAKLAPDRRTLFMKSKDGGLCRMRVDDAEIEQLPLNFLGGSFYSLGIDSTVTCLAGGGVNMPLQVLDMDADQAYVIPLFDTLVTILGLDPKGRWVAVAGSDELGILKLVPRPEGKPMEDATREGLLDWLGTLTNLEARQDEEAEFGYRVEGEGLPDWNSPPHW